LRRPSSSTGTMLEAGETAATIPHMEVRPPGWR
jgi:hypothetical protein